MYNLGSEERIFVDGKSLRQIAAENNLTLDCVRHRYCRGAKTYEELGKPTTHQRRVQKSVKTLPYAGQRVLYYMLENDIGMMELHHATGISRTNIHSFIYNGTNISMINLMKICAYLKLSADYVLGLSPQKEISKNSEK